MGQGGQGLVAERCRVVRRDVAVARWAAAAAIGGPIGLFSVLVLEGLAPVVVGGAAITVALWWDRRRGFLPELWPADTGLYRFAVTVLRLQRRGWLVFPHEHGYVVVGTSGVVVLAHFLCPNETVDVCLRLPGGLGLAVRHRCAEELADRLTAALPTAGDIATLVTVAVSPRFAGRLRAERSVVPVDRLAEALTQMSPRLSDDELRDITDRLPVLLPAAERP